MPLDPIAARYAQTVYLARLQELSKKYAGRTAEAVTDLARRGLYPHTAGHYYSEIARVGIQHVEELTDARVDTLLEAYQKAGIPIDAASVTAINHAAAEVFDTQGRNLIANIREQMGRHSYPQAAAQSIAGTIEAAMSHVRSRINYKLSALRDEQILAARSASRRELETDRTETTENVTKPVAGEWTRVEKWTAAGVIVGLIALLAIFFVPEVRIFLHLDKKLAPKPVASAVTDQNKAKDAFSVSIEDKIFSMGGAVPTQFWVVQGTRDGGCVLSAVDMLLFLSITNLQSKDVMISTYNVKMGNIEFQRLNMLVGSLVFLPNKGTLPRLGASINWIPGAEGHMSAQDVRKADPSHAAEIVGAQILDTQLAGKYLAPYKTARGWAFFQFPNQSLMAPMGDFLITVGDQIGETFQYPILHVNPEGNSNGDVLPRTTTIGKIQDLSACSLERRGKN